MRRSLFASSPLATLLSGRSRHRAPLLDLRPQPRESHSSKQGRALAEACCPESNKMIRHSEMISTLEIVVLPQAPAMIVQGAHSPAILSVFGVA